MGAGGPGPHSHPTPASDPNYAQQFHNFQQQLYATNTRNNQMGQNNGPPPGAVGPQGKQIKEMSRMTNNVAWLKFSFVSFQKLHFSNSKEMSTLIHLVYE